MASKEISTKSLPFRNFFINSYILPGFLFLFATVLVCFVFRKNLAWWSYFKNSEFESIIKDGSLLKFFTTDISFFTEFSIILILLFISIIIGNAISVLAGLVFDNFWFGKGIGWPYERILSYYPKNYTNRAIHILLFTALNFVCLTFIFFDFYIKIWLYAILFVFIFKDAFRIIYNWIYGDDIEIREFIKELNETKRNRLFETMWLFKKKLFKNRSIWNIQLWMTYIFTFAFLLDISVILAIFFGKFFGLTHGIDKISRKKFKRKFKEVININHTKNDTNIYWYTYIYLVNKNPENIRIANSHLKRSILVRNLAAVGVIVFIILMTLKPENDPEMIARWTYWSKVWYVSSYLLFIGYNNIIYKYYTKYIIRSFIVGTDENCWYR